MSEHIEDQINHVIARLQELDVDGETMQYILEQVGMDEQMLRQLVLQANPEYLQDLIGLRPTKFNITKQQNTMSNQFRTTMTAGNFSVFLNPVFRMQINPSLEVVAEMQVICFEEKGEWKYDDIHIMDIVEINYSGFSITEMEKVSTFIEHHKSMGIDIWNVVSDEAEKIIRQHEVEEFMESYSPLKTTK